MTSPLKLVWSNMSQKSSSLSGEISELTCGLVLSSPFHFWTNSEDHIQKPSFPLVGKWNHIPGTSSYILHIYKITTLQKIPFTIWLSATTVQGDKKRLINKGKWRYFVARVVAMVQSFSGKKRSGGCLNFHSIGWGWGRGTQRHNVVVYKYTSYMIVKFPLYLSLHGYACQIWGIGWGWCPKW